MHFWSVRGVILLCLVFIFIIYLIEDIDKLPLTFNDTYSVKIGYSFSKLILPILPVENLITLKMICCFKIKIINGKFKVCNVFHF